MAFAGVGAVVGLLLLLLLLLLVWARCRVLGGGGWEVGCYWGGTDAGVGVAPAAVGAWAGGAYAA